VSYEDECAHCGAELTGRKRRFCSQRCRTAASRSMRPMRPCRLCGDLFLPEGPGQPSTCPYDDAPPACQDLQDDEEDRQASVRASRALSRADTCQGPGCASQLLYGGRGRPPRYCSRACRNRATRKAS
jgi:hypothetical protein